MAKPAKQAVEKPKEQIAPDHKKELAKLKTRFKTLEENLEKATLQKKALEDSLADPLIYSNKEKFLKAEGEYAAATKRFREATEAYEEVFEKIIALEA